MGDPIELRRLYWDDGLSTREIAKKLSVNQNTVTHRMKVSGIPARSKSEATLLQRRKRKKERLLSELRRLYWDDGLSTREIAKKLGVNQSTVTYKMKVYGISARSKREAELLHQTRMEEERLPTRPEDYCRVCKFWLLRHMTAMGARIYFCRLFKNPEIKQGELTCSFRRLRE